MISGLHMLIKYRTLCSVAMAPFPLRNPLLDTALRNMDGDFMPFLLAQLGVHHGEDHDV